MKESQDYIKNMMNFLKDNSGFKNYFAQDLLKRGNLTAIKISKDDYAKMKWDMHSHAIRIELKDNEILEPHALAFFAQQIMENDYLPEGKMRLEYIKALFDIQLAYSIFFMRDKTSSVSIEILNGCMQALNMVE